MVAAAVGLAACIPIALGLLVVSASTQRRIGWLLVAHGLSVGLLLRGSPPGAGPDSTSTASASSGSRVSLVVDQLTQGSWVFLFLWLVLLAYLMPDGRLPSKGWRWWVGAGVVGVLLFVVGAAGDEAQYRTEHGGQAPPVPWLPPALAGPVGALGLLLVVLLFFGSAVAVRGRLRRTSGEARTQLLWLVWGAVAVPLGLLLVWTNHFLLDDQDWLTVSALTAVSLALPVAIAIAILRHRLFDVRLVLSRTLTYGVLTLAVVALYALLLLAVERLGGNGSVGGLLAVAVVAVAVHPVHSWLRRAIERHVYGYRSEPHRALRILADRAEAAEPESLRTSITQAVAEALRIDQVRVDLAGADSVGVDRSTAATSEVEGDGSVRVPLVHRGERLGALVVEVPPGRHLSSADLSLLDDLARYAAVLVRSERQADQLRQSRSGIVSGREEERRRLRRDLHDGIGPSLAAIVLKLNAAQSRADAAGRDALLGEARAEVKDAIAEIRRLVDDLRPPAIDEVGLVGAIRQRAATLTGDVTFEVDGPAHLPSLPAAVEVAAFRIASEAMTNVARHSGASHCRVTISLDGAFELTVADDGQGADRSVTRGVGWRSMQERAAELGGSCTISNRRAGDGLLVRAVLPFSPRLGQPVVVESPS